MLQIFVAFPYDREPLEGYREVYRGIEKSNDVVRFVFADERIASGMVLTQSASGTRASIIRGQVFS